MQLPGSVQGVAVLVLIWSHDSDNQDLFSFRRELMNPIRFLKQSDSFIVTVTDIGELGSYWGKSERMTG